jgi:hypothetical protein
LVSRENRAIPGSFMQLRKDIMKKILLAVLALVSIALVTYLAGIETAPLPEVAQDHAVTGGRAGDGVIEQAFQSRRSGVQVSGDGEVLKVLRDDVEGSRHQRFIVRLQSGHTILIAHNIDLAPRVPSLKPGAAIEFHGVYEWSAQGGTVHWTHHDPDGDHEAGWIRYEGHVYQ